MNKNIFQILDQDGNLVAIQVPVEIIPESFWQKIAPGIKRPQKDPGEAKAEKPEPIEAFEEFLQYWNFRYQYSPAVTCPNCQTKTENWREDPAHPFRLANANFGGLLVFHCKNCGATIRQKHFRDHVAFEYSQNNA